MQRRLIVFLATACLLFANHTWAQSSNLNLDTLQAKMRLYSKINASGLLFVHTDKTLYTNNETIWFAGYLIISGPGKIDDHTLLSVSLMREVDRRIVCEQQNVMKDGMANGSLPIPDNVPPGNYVFNAFTNVMDQHGNPVALFSQRVTIKSITQRNFSASLLLLDTLVSNGAVRASVTLNIKDEKRSNKPTVTYSIGGGKTQSITLAENENQAHITLQASQLAGAEPVLLTAIAYNYDTLYLSVKLPKPQVKSGLSIRFFPEGGQLTGGLESLVALEAKTTNGLQVPLSGVLYRNDEPIDTITTNSYGVGQFKLKPDLKNIYTFRIKANNYLDRDSVYKLPDIIDNGLVLQFNEAIVNDTLKLRLYSKESKKVQVVIHNYKETFSLINSYAYPQGKNLSLVVSGLPKGVATVTILDEDGKPLAERLFFAHYNQKNAATIKTNKQLYGKRDSVSITINLKDNAGNPVLGLLSVAAVQENRIDRLKYQQIDNYVFLGYELGDLPPDPLNRGIDSKDYLEAVFLTKGWRRYTWQNLILSKAADTVKIGPQPQFQGKVLYYDHALKKPHNLLTIPNINTVTTNADGTFMLTQQQITVPEGRKVFLWLNKKNVQGYSLTTSNPYYNINHQVAQKIVIANNGVAKAAANSVEQQFSGFGNTTLLKVVHIKANKKDEILFGADAINDCGDYVCSTGFLNCPFDPPARLPEKGQIYKRLTGAGTRMPSIIYEGCTKNGQQSTAVYTAREFYGLNRDPDYLSEPQYLSTLFWKPGIITNEKGEASFSFFTGDIEGRFRIVVQGVGSDGVIYGGNEFSVK